MSAAIKGEHEDPQSLPVDDWKATTNYLVQTSLLTFDVHRLEDLLWAYKKVTKHSVNFIPVGRSYQAILHFYSGSVEIGGPEQQMNAVLGYMQRRVPWAALGYSAALEHRFSRELKAFCAEIRQRRQAMKAQVG